MTGTRGHVHPPAGHPPEGHGLAVLAAVVDLQPTASGTWTDVPVEVTLPEAGTYRLDASVRGNLSGSAPYNAFIVARLWDVTAGVVVPASESLVIQKIIGGAAGVSEGGNNTAPIQVEYAVPGPAVIRLQAQRTATVGATARAGIHSDGNGRTTLRYQEVGP